MTGSAMCSRLGHSRIQRIVSRRDGVRVQCCTRCGCELAELDNDSPFGEAVPVAVVERFGKCGTPKAKRRRGHQFRKR